MACQEAGPYRVPFNCKEYPISVAGGHKITLVQAIFDTCHSGTMLGKFQISL